MLSGFVQKTGWQRSAVSSSCNKIFFELAELKKEYKYLLSAGITWSREVHICRNTCEEDFMLFVI